MKLALIKVRCTFPDCARLEAELTKFCILVPVELFYLSDVTCPCVSSSQACPLKLEDVAPPVDETGLDVTVLREGVWFYGTLPSDQLVRYYRFEIPYDPDIPCPVVNLDMQTDLGLADGFISRGRIPTETSHDWTMPSNSREHIVLCPFLPQVTYGTYYIAMADRSNSAINSFGLRLQISNAISCPASNPVPPTPSPNWVNTSQAVYVSMAPLEVQHYQLYFEIPTNETRRCFQFSAAISGLVAGTNGDIFASTTSQKPHQSGSADWAAQTSRDDSISALICLPNTQNSTTIYMAIYNRATVSYSYLFTAKADYDIQKAPVAELLFSQSAHTLNFGSSPKMICAGQVFTCHAPPSPKCDADGSNCCYIFRNLPPTKDPTPLVPWNAFDTSIPSINQIPWNEPDSMVPGRLAWALFLSRTDSSGGVEYTQADPASCRVVLGDMLLNSNNEKVTGEISFDMTIFPCDATQYADRVRQIRSMVDAMSSLTDYYDLALQQLRLNIMAMDDSLLGCSPVLARLIQRTVTSRAIPSFSACFADVGSAAWGSDPCCNRTLALTSCCASSFVPFSVSQYTNLNSNQLSSICANPTCANRAAENLILSDASINNAVTGCSSQFLSSASIQVKANLESPLSTCLNRLFTTDLRNIRCLSDSDCVSPAMCNMSTLLCNHTMDELIICVSNTLDSNVARALYGIYGADPSLEVSAANTYQLIANNDYEVQCSGEGSIAFITSYHYEKLDSNCKDSCATPICLDANCAVPDNCNSAVTPSACDRHWVLVLGNNQTCLDYLRCNWAVCDDTMLPATCEAMCLNASLSNQTCVNCAGGACLELPGWDQTRCMDGLCNLGAGYSSAACLANNGTCSVTCAGCNTQLGCESRGFCSDAAYLSTYVNSTTVQGVCVAPLTYNIDGVYCAINGSIRIPSGCIDLSFTNASACNDASSTYVWEVLATNQQDCINKGSACLNSLGVPLPLSTQECSLCSSATITPYYTWTSGQWTSARVQELNWVTRATDHPFTLASTPNIVSLRSHIENAAADVLTYPFITDALCRYTTSYTVASSLVCDCTPSSAGNCFSSISNQRVGANRACYGSSSVVNTRVGTLTVYPYTMPAGSLCELVTLYSTSASEYELDQSHSLSSAIFQSSPTNSFWVVKRQGLDVAVGQIVSGAVNITVGAVAGPMRLCIFVESDITIANVAQVWSLAELNNGVIQSFLPSSTLTYNATSATICDFIPGAGAYFATKLVKDYQTQQSDSTSNRRQAKAGAVLYLLTVAFAALQGTVLTINRVREKLFRLKLVFVILVGLNALVRGVYMVVPSNQFVGNESIQFIIFELPSFLFFSVYLSIIYLWVNVTLKASQWRKRKRFLGDAESISRDVFILANIILYAIFIVFMFLISILPSIEKPSVCFLGTQNDTLRNTSFYRVKLAYWCIVAGVCVLVSVGFLIGAFSLLRLVLSVERSGVSKHAQGDRQAKRMNKLFLITGVAAVCTVFLLIRSALFLYAAITSKPINTMVFVMLEVVPSCGLLYYLRPYFLSNLFKSSKTSSRSGRTSDSATPRSGHDQGTTTSSD